MARKSKDSSKGTSKQTGRMSRRAILSGLGAGLVLTLGPGKKALGAPPTPTPTPPTGRLAYIPDLSNGYIELPEHGGHLSFTVDKASGRITVTCTN